MSVPASLVPAFALLALVLAGCGQPEAQPDVQTVLAPAREPGPLPVTQKLEFASTVAPLLPQVMPSEPAAAFDAGPAGRLLLAFDLAGEGTLNLRVVAPSGATVYEGQPAPGKLVLEPGAESGTYEVFAESPDAWELGLVATAFPPGFDEGTRVQVSFPQQTEIEHAFRPDHLEAPTGEPTRLSLYDFDPHTGIRNLQHNLHFPTLDLRTEGRTTWGEVRVLDLPGLAAGSYPFECEFHGFAGTLTVA